MIFSSIETINELGQNVLLAVYYLEIQLVDFQVYKENSDSYICSLLTETPFATAQFTPGGLLYTQDGSNLQYVTTSSFLLLTYVKHLGADGMINSCGELLISGDVLVSHAKRQIDYILGDNPMNMSYMVDLVGGYYDAGDNVKFGLPMAFTTTMDVRSAHLFDVIVIIIRGEAPNDGGPGAAPLISVEPPKYFDLQKKMHFLLTTLKVVYVLSTPSPEWSENENLETTRKRMKWENDDCICSGHILNGEVKTIVEDKGVVETVVQQEKYPENIDFHTEGEENVVLEKFPIDDLFLTKRECNLRTHQQLKHALVDYEVADGYQLWYYRSDGNRLQREELLVVLRLQRDELLHQTMHIQMEEEERRRLVGEEEHMEYKYNLDMEWGHFSDNENDRPGTISELHALEEAHVQHNADLPSVSHGSTSVQAAVEFQSHPRPLDTTPTIMEAEIGESQAPPLNPSQRKRHLINQRNKSKRITKRRKLTF
nr:endoglucanase 1-like [Tanacetum cinerariifolium]